ncbi:MAG: hypothetical protein ACKO1M_02020 [Planctomycetota bacterium]
MLYVENNRDLVAAVSQALGESRSLVRNRGFQLIEIVVFNGDESHPDGGDSAMPDDAGENDAVDLAAVAGLDWDCHDDSRLHRRYRRRRRVA